MLAEWERARPAFKQIRKHLKNADLPYCAAVYS
jgi:hypothetical protein